MSLPPLFLVESLPDGADAVLDGPEGRHAATVRRLRPGERLTLSDGRGELAECAVAAVTWPDSLRLDVLRRWQQPPPQPRVTLAQALVKGDRGELAVELATEAGVDAVQPWLANRCVARWPAGERGERALRRWAATATQAAKQSRRAWLPTVAAPVDTAGLAGLVDGADLALVLHQDATARLADLELPASGELLLAVGPEGGIDDAELTTLTAAGAIAVRLGPTVLRTSTAGVVALGALGVLTERWA